MYTELTLSIYILFTVFPPSVFSDIRHKILPQSNMKNTDLKPRVRLTNDGPTTLGGKTTFFAEVSDCNQGRQAKYRFCWYPIVGEQCRDVASPVDKFIYQNWTAPGKQTFSVEVEQINSPWKSCGQSKSTVYVTESINAKLSASPQIPGSADFYVGPVNLSVQIYDPSHMFDPKKIMYTWDFDDNLTLKTPVKALTHNFTEDRDYRVTVLIVTHVKGNKYNGSVSKKMCFEVNFAARLLIHNLQTLSPLRLPSESSSTVYVTPGEVELTVLHNNPYSIIQNISTGWRFGQGPTIQNLPGYSVKHNYTNKGKTIIWATSQFITKNKHKTSIFEKHVVVEEPISNDFNITAPMSSITHGYLLFNVTCSGSPPFKMCWKVLKSSSPDKPLLQNCTSLYQTCHFQINQTMAVTSSFTLDVLVLNHVGSLHAVKHFTVPGPTPKPSPSVAAEAASAVIPVVVCVLLLVIILLFFAKKVYSSRHRSVLETANFDFRDEDCRSVGSVDGNEYCSSLRFWRRFSKKPESYPLLQQWEVDNRRHSTYSDIL